MRERWKCHPGLGIFSGVVAFLFAAAMVFGQGLNDSGEIPIRRLSAGVSLVVLFLEAWVLLFLLLAAVREGKLQFLTEGMTGSEDGRRAAGTSPFPVWLLLLICWLPAFLAVYPGFFLYDAYDEYMQMATGVFSTHHPLLHVWLLGGIVYQVHALTGAYNFGIALYTALQMMIIAACFVFVLHLMKRNGVRLLYRRIVFLYFAFFPNVVMFTLCSTKDTLFAAALLVAVLLLVDRRGRRDIPADDPGEHKWRRVRFFLPLIVSLTLAMLLRNNAVYAFVASALILVVIGKGRRLQTIAVCAVTLCCYLLGTWGLTLAFHAEKGGAQETLTVPIQQISRVYHADPSLLSEEDKEILFSYLPEEAIARYTPKLSDPVKIHFNNEQYESAKLPFWKLWLKLFTKSPIGYANAWLMTSYGYWYPDADVDVYKGHAVFTHCYENSSYFGFETEQPGERDSKLPLLERFYKEVALYDVVQKIPGISWMFSMGALFWICVLCACVMVAKKRYERLVPFVFPAFVWLTLLPGPTYLPRYVVFMWYLIPVLLMETMLPDKAKEAE